MRRARARVQICIVPLVLTVAEVSSSFSHFLSELPFTRLPPSPSLPSPASDRVFPPSRSFFVVVLGFAFDLVLGMRLYRFASAHAHAHLKIKN